MDFFLEFFSAHIGYWPLVVFFALLLAGVNIPVSEDAIIILSAGVCIGDEKLIAPTLVALYFGIVISDTMAYWLGFLCSKGMKRFKKIQRLLNSHKTAVVIDKIEKKGFLTFVSLRFIPFGIRNLLFLSSGFFHVKFWKFIFFDFSAAFISSMTLFWLSYIVGSDAELIFRIIGAVLLFFVLVFVVFNVIKIRREFADDAGN